MDTLSIRPVTEDNWRAIAELKPHPHQASFVAPNTESMLEAVYETRFAWSTYGLYVDAYPVGFAMIGAFHQEKGYIWLDRYMIDSQHQGKGYGSLFLTKILNYIQQNWPVKDIVLSIEPENQQAEQLYKKAGFTKTGIIDEDNGEHVMVYKVKKR
ncbi:GNAT family N-acetyltransferase [Marinilactibacillus piezotolerans]|uniref:GNAT family N-acetyltransferase n=1 Tax=Marinilactibacillus piezotolerans TaxID=258723 RepID=UPI0009B02B93|nr:GNAT family N-acetyltransferase [Marinilactibacillus piezotolerans]